MELKQILNWWLDPWNFLSGVMSAVALIGTVYNAERNIMGFLFWLVSNLYMSIRFFVIGEYAQGVLFFIYFILAIKGLAVWEQKDKQDKRNKRKAERIDEYIEDYEKRHRL